MEYRQLGGSGLRVPVLSFGTATWGGGNEFFKAWGSTERAEAKRMVDLCIDAGANFLDTADGYSLGLSEEILGDVIAGRRDKVLIATKTTFPMGPDPNDYGASRYRLIRACEASLKRLKTDHIDLYYMHGFDAHTPVEETLRALDDLVREGKIRYIGCSNFSGWHLMKCLSVSERCGLSRYVAHQVSYSLVGRELEWELIPLALDQMIGTVVWSPLAGGALTGKIKRGEKVPENSRLQKLDLVSALERPRVYDAIETVVAVANEIGKSPAQVALNWVLNRPSVTSVLFGARNEEQLKQNLGAIGWNLSQEHIDKLDQASSIQTLYPYWHQHQFPMLGIGPLTKY
ncbi:MAG: aldo/keto reductase [Candidatus Hydrogenedentes bacterium]|nr:aldo/keto reductase [Candidatus Hydrogenedentota bacterium]